MSTDIDAMKAAVVAQMRALGLTPDDLTTLLDDGAAPPVTVADFIDTTLWPTLTPGNRTTLGTYLNVIKHGMPGLCSCACDTCMDHFRGTSQWTPCPCVTAADCTCRYNGAAKGRVAATSCLTGCTPLGERALRSVSVAEWTELQYWVQTRAAKRTVSRNRARSDDGRPTFLHDGRNAVEIYVGALCAIYRLAVGTVPGVNTDLSSKLTKQKRSVGTARAYSADQLDELWTAIFTSGSSDTELDMLITWFQLETGSRRGGPLSVSISDCKFHTNKVGLQEKGDNYVEQPVSEALLAVLLRHAMTRGNVIAANPQAIAVDEITLDVVREGRVKLRNDEPVFYYQPRIGDDGARVPHPLTRRRFETLWKRLRRELPWLEAMHGRPHDLRKTMGTFVERAFGHAVAQGWLRHAVADTTGVYTQAASDEIERAHSWIIGKQQ